MIMLIIIIIINICFSIVTFITQPFGYGITDTWLGAEECSKRTHKPGTRAPHVSRMALIKVGAIIREQTRRTSTTFCQATCRKKCKSRTKYVDPGKVVLKNVKMIIKFQPVQRIRYCWVIIDHYKNDLLSVYIL